MAHVSAVVKLSCIALVNKFTLLRTVYCEVQGGYIAESLEYFSVMMKLNQSTNYIQQLALV